MAGNLPASVFGRSKSERSITEETTMTSASSWSAALRRTRLFRLPGLLAATFLSTLLSIGSASAAEFQWRYYSVVGPAHPYGKILADGFKRIEERTGGRLKITLVSFGETPYKGSEADKLMRDDLADMTEWLLGYSTGTYPLLSGPELPLLAPQPLGPEAMIKAINKAWETPALKQTVDKLLKDHRAIRLGSFYWPPQNHWFRTKVDGPAGFKGMKIREFSAEGIDFTKAIGAVPVSITAPEVYTALQRGALDGAVTASTSMTGLKWGEVLKAGYITNHKLTISLVLINERRFNRLPKDIQDVLTAEVARSTGEILDFMVRNEAELHKQLMKDYGFAMVYATPADYAALRKVAAEQVWPAWVKRVGPATGRAVINEVLEALGAPERF
jgi:TRAP-type C4-dicarboxylate transport system substrate-binding protein